MDTPLTERTAFPAEAIVFVIALVGMALVAITLFAMTYVFPDGGGFVGPRMITVDPGFAEPGLPPDVPRAMPGP